MRALVAALLLAGAPALALAQQTPPPPPAQPTVVPAEPLDRPISGFVLDARGVLAKFGQRPLTAAALGVQAKEMPGPGMGGSIGAHVYLFRMGRVALGVGGEVLIARRTRQPIDAQGEADGTPLKSRLFAISPQVSLNFGHRNGWSYVSGGLGSASYETWADTATMPERRVRSINYGGGARWFSASHVAVTIDLRFHAIAAGPAEGTTLIERPSQRLMVLSAGFSVR